MKQSFQLPLALLHPDKCCSRKGNHLSFAAWIERSGGFPFNLQECSGWNKLPSSQLQRLFGPKRFALEETEEGNKNVACSDQNMAGHHLDVLYRPNISSCDLAERYLADDQMVPSPFELGHDT